MNFTRDFGDGVGGITPVLRARRIFIHIVFAAIGAMLGLMLLAAALYCGASLISYAYGRDNGWESTPANERKWFQSLMQPDNPQLSCCGEADAYEADDYDREGDHYVAIITDTRSDTFPNGAFRPHIAPGTRISIPNTKMKWDQGNPTIHGYVFIGSSGILYCYVAPGGV